MSNESENPIDLRLNKYDNNNNNSTTDKFSNNVYAIIAVFICILGMIGFALILFYYFYKRKHSNNVNI